MAIVQWLSASSFFVKSSTNNVWMKICFDLKSGWKHCCISKAFGSQLHTKIKRAQSKRSPNIFHLFLISMFSKWVDGMKRNVCLSLRLSLSSLDCLVVLQVGLFDRPLVLSMFRLKFVSSVKSTFWSRVLGIAIFSLFCTFLWSCTYSLCTLEEFDTLVPNFIAVLLQKDLLRVIWAFQI